jgi:hypothetical protein
MDSIVGGRIATNGVVKLTIDSDKVGYIFLPNGTILTTNGSGVIDTTYTGVGGAITYYVPKTNEVVIAVTSGLSGDIIWNGDASEQFYVGFNSELTGVTALNQETGLVNVATCAALTKLIAPKATIITATNCALTAKSIGDILYAAYIANRANVDYDFSGGTNADEEEVADYYLANYGESYTIAIGVLDALGGEIQFEPA